MQRAIEAGSKLNVLDGHLQLLVRDGLREWKSHLFKCTLFPESKRPEDVLR